MTESLIDLHTQLEKFNLHVHFSWRGRVLGVFGPSGAGKSVFIESLVGIHPTEGKAAVSGYTVMDTPNGFEPPLYKRSIGWVPQDASLFPHLTCKQNIQFAHRSDGSMNIESLLDIFELKGVKDQLPPKLSGGEKIRTALARAIASNPKVLLLDEPMAALDVPLRHRIFPYLLKLKEQFSMPMIFVSHNVDEIWSFTDYVIILDKGSVMASGPTQSTLESSDVPKLEDTLNQYNRFEATVLDASSPQKVRLASGQILYTSQWIENGRNKTYVNIPPDEILVSLAKIHLISARNQIQGTIVDMRNVKGSKLMTVDAGEHWTVRITENAQKELKFEIGKEVNLIFKASAVRISLK